MVMSLVKQGLAFGEVTSVMMGLYDIAEAKKETFVGRLQQLQKAGIPAGANLGRGAKVRYSASQLIVLMTSLDLLECGVTPATLAVYFGQKAELSLDSVFSPEEGDFGRAMQVSIETNIPLYFLFRPSALSYLQNAAQDKNEIGLAVELKPERALARIDEKPAIAINLSERISALKGVVAAKYPANVDEFDFVGAAIERGS